MARRARNSAGALLEDPFRLQVEQLAQFYGWLVYHTHDSRRSAPGFPDDVMVRGPELLFVEFKTDTGRVRPEQTVWLEALGVVAHAARSLEAAARSLLGDDLDAVPYVEAHVWRPRDFDAVIHTRLARGRLRQEPIERLDVPPPAANPPTGGTHAAP